MDNKKPSYLNAATSAAQIAAAGNFNDDPYSIELERLDVFEMADNNSAFMSQVIDMKKSILEEAKLVSSMLRLDQTTWEDPKNAVVGQRSKRPKRPPTKKMVRRRNVDDDDDDEMEVNVDGTAVGTVELGVETTKSKAEGEDSSDEDEPAEDDLEEDNDYMDSHFDNGEDYAD